MVSKEKMKPYVKVLYWVGGTLCFLIGILFLFLTVFPAIPFLGLAIFLFSKVSESVRQMILSFPFGRRWLLEASASFQSKRVWIFLMVAIAMATIVGVGYWFWRRSSNRNGLSRLDFGAFRGRAVWDNSTEGDSEY